MEPIKKIVIVGGGTAGWVTASLIANECRNKSFIIELVESEEIGTIGVGESTIPPFVEMLRILGIDEIDFIKNTSGSFKLGIEFSNWRKKGESYFHPFGTMTSGAGLTHFKFFNLWLKAVKNGETFGLQDFSPCHIMAKNRRFLLPALGKSTPIEEASYALHLDAKLIVRYLRNYCENLGVIRTEGKVTEVTQHDNEFIRSIILQSGQEIEADFFVDCSGFRALLIEKTLKVSYCDWTHYLPCNRAIAVQTENVGEIVPFTKAMAQDHGWIWRIPLQHRNGNGYVFSSEFCSDDEAIKTLLDVVDGELLHDPIVIPFKTGVRDEVWKGNCVAIGLSAGFIEPLESTAIHLAVRGVIHFLRNFPDKQCDASLIKEYNRRMKIDYEEIRDFIVMHYCLTQRDDTPFWRWWRNMELPPSLKDAIDLYKVQGGLIEQIDPLFTGESWRSVAEGMGLHPAKYTALVDDFELDEIVIHFKKYIETTNHFIQKLPTHDQFIQLNCAAINPNRK